MTSITSWCEIFCQFVQKKQEEKRIEEEQAAKAQTWKLFDDDDDEESSNSLNDNISELPSFFAIILDEPVLSTEMPDNSLSMGDEHLDTILATESDQLIKSGVETLIPIPSESEGIPEHVCDVPFHDNSPPLDELAEYINTPGWNRPAFCDDDDDDVDYTIAITPVLSTEEPDNSISMGDEHLDTILATESDEVIKSSVEDLVLIPSESEGIPDTMYDVHLVNNPTLLKAKDHLEIVINSNDD
nr:hypothetical protein [Tanacetum cinerariifolium]